MGPLTYPLECRTDRRKVKLLQWAFETLDPSELRRRFPRGLGPVKVEHEVLQVRPKMVVQYTPIFRPHVERQLTEFRAMRRKGK